MKILLHVDGLDGAERVRVKAFEEIGWEPAGGDDESIDMAAILARNGNDKIACATDVARYMMLDKFGGIWLDADIVVLRDLSPLQGASFAHMYGDLINNAVMGTECPGSPFMRELLSAVGRELTLAKRYRSMGYGWLVAAVTAVHDNYFKYGGSLLKEIEASAFFRLPQCFFDIGGYGFFEDPSRTGMADLFQTLRVGRKFTYHWHGQWNAEIEAGSPFARELDRLTQLLSASAGAPSGAKSG